MPQVTKVEYYNNGELIGTRTEEPFNQFLWDGVPFGTHHLKAVLFIDGIAMDSTEEITVTAFNTAPVGHADNFYVNEDSVLVVNAPGVLLNDTDAQSDQTLTAELVTTTSNGELVLGSDGSFAYTPNPDWFGEDSFVYRAFDSIGYSEETLVTITVHDVNEPPEGQPDYYELFENEVLTTTAFNGVLSNDFDFEGDVLTATLHSQPTNGTLEFNPDGSFVYTPNTDWLGTDTFEYTVSDGEDTTEPITVTIEVKEFVPWNILVIEDYKERVRENFGQLEDETELNNDLVVMGEEDYREAIVIYNPNGGYATGKVFDFTDSTLGDENLISDSVYFKNNWTSGTSFLTEVEEEKPQKTKGKVQLFDVPNSALGLRHESNAPVGQYNISIWVKKANENSPDFFSIATGNGNDWNSGNSQKFSITDTWQRLELNTTITGTGNLTVFFGAGNSSGSVNSDSLGEIFIFAPQATSGYGIKEYSQTPKSDLTVTGGGGTRINKDGLVEYMDKNSYLNNSEVQFMDWDFTPTGETIKNSDYKIFTYVPPNEGTKQYYIRAFQGNNSYQGIYNVSLYVKSTGSNVRYVTIDTGTTSQNRYTRFDIIDGIIYNDPNNYCSISDEGDGWFRISVEHGWNSYYVFALFDDISGYTYTPNGEDGVLVYGLQMTKGGGLFPYQPSQGSIFSPKIDYSTGKPAFLIEPTRTNYEPRSYDLTAWSKSNGATTELNAVGITGEPNTATTVSDTVTSAYSEIERGLISLTPSRYRYSVWVKKDSNGAVLELYVRFRVSSGEENNLVHLDVATGEIGTRGAPNYQDSEHYVLDRGDWWEIVVITVSESDRFIGSTIRPTWNTTINGSMDATVTGSIVIGHIGLYQSTSIYETPIITNGSTVTRTENKFNGAVPYIRYFTFFMHFKVVGTETGVMWIYLSSNNNSPFLIGINAEGKIYTKYSRYDSYNLIGDAVVGNEYKVALVVRSDKSYWTYVNGVNHGADTSIHSRYGIDRIGTYRPWTDVQGFYNPIYDLRVLPEITDQEAIELTTL